jgi:hypothetical protein
MKNRAFLLVPLTLLLSACPGPDEEAREELPLPPAPAAVEGDLQGRVGAEAAGSDWQVCAFRVDGEERACSDVDGPTYTLRLPEGRYQVLAFGPGDQVGAHTASTTCLRDGGVDCSDGTLLEVEVVAGASVPAIDVLDFANARPDWPQRPAR